MLQKVHLFLLLTENTPPGAGPNGHRDFSLVLPFCNLMLTGDNYFLETGRKATLEKMAPHVSHTGVHDHGFNNLSTYGNLLRLMNEGKFHSMNGKSIFMNWPLKFQVQCRPGGGQK
jgi:hypothetical protein